MPVNNVDKRMEGKGPMKVAEEDLKTLFLEKGGLVAKVKQPKQVKKINIAEYFAPGKTVASLTQSERDSIKAMLNKMLKGVSEN